LTIILLGGLYFGLRLGFGFFTPYNSLTARQDITNGQIQIIAIGLPYMPQVRQRLAKQYGFEYNYVGCNATTELLNGTEYYNNVVKEYLTDKFGKDFWTKFNTQLNSIDNAATDVQKPTTTKLPYKSVSDIIADTSYSTWVKLKDNSASLAIHFMEKNILSISYSPECWLIYPYKLDDNKIIVTWDNNIDTKYDFDIVKAINKTDKKYIGKTFMVLELVNDTTLKATYPIPDIIRKINSSSKQRTFFPDKFTLIDFYI
jgi:hypothetical protein